jgi:hypothetical protein
VLLVIVVAMMAKITMMVNNQLAGIMAHQSSGSDHATTIHRQRPWLLLQPLKRGCNDSDDDEGVAAMTTMTTIVAWATTMPHQS